MFSLVLYKAVGFGCILLLIRFPTGATLYSADTFMIIVCLSLPGLSAISVSGVCEECRFTIAWHNAEL